MATKILDRAICSYNEASKGGTRYLTIPKRFRDVAGEGYFGGKVEVTLVEHEAGEKVIEIHRFVP